ncbi:MAG: hypothetical protein WBW11_02655 [Pseudolabrys sp.]
MPPASALWLDVTRTVPLVHFIQPFAKSAERHRHFDNVGILRSIVFALARPL